MTPVEAADRELRLVVERLRSWAQDPPPAMQGLAPAAAFAFAANVLELYDHHRDGAPEDVQAIERRVDLIEWLMSEEPTRYSLRALACELGAPESDVAGDLAELERVGLVVQSRLRCCGESVLPEDGTVVWGCPGDIDVIVRDAGIRALVSQVEQ